MLEKNCQASASEHNKNCQAFASKLACVATNATTERKQRRTGFGEQARVRGSRDDDDDRQAFASKLAVDL